MDPVIVFSFAKKECEQNAVGLKAMDLTDDDEKETIEQIFVSAMDALSAEDRALPQVAAMLPLL